MKKTLLAAMSACTLLYSCVAAAQNKPSPELEYINTLSSIAHHCNFLAGLARSAYRLSTDFGNQKAQEVIACSNEGTEKGKAAFKAAMASQHPSAIRDGIKKVYSRWQTYMDSIDATAPADAAAERAFSDAANDLKLDIENP
ncbi:hypothetical protein RN01_03950 [Cupriavidus sp. SHE]|jgi:opacity protein-like surface antigen|uniref:Uncharacterized protein n=1 Tax=Cupriavidus metallidurans TaxID=119219 RepID=A0A2L0XBC9_9BURK|nr:MULTISPECIES: hypothetical protein [Cupriavidus]AVA37417.1 hypothetical protein C3Z06_29800 [Cupriavidus metallidurans]KWR85964.1 hypothetical protein RN01_03950 [Cupriavidus sp. SHE]QBP11425.1 hypothetical protein DDF84_017585 [Cupriavidus metallidurans]